MSYSGVFQPSLLRARPVNYFYSIQRTNVQQKTIWQMIGKYLKLERLITAQMLEGNFRQINIIGWLVGDTFY